MISRGILLILISIIGLFLACDPNVGHREGADLLSATSYHSPRSNIYASLSRFENGKTGRIAFLGGSITYNDGWRDSLEQYFVHRFPNTDFEFVRAGIPSMGSTPSAFRLERDVLSKGRVDLLFQEAAVNDDTNGRTRLEQLRATEGIVRHFRESNPVMDIVFMHFVDLGKIASYRADSIPEVIRNHELIAEHYDIPSINLAKEVTERIDNGEFTWKDDFIDLHPSAFGQGVYSRSMIEFLESRFSQGVPRRERVTPYAMPVLLTKGAYDNGRLIDVSEAVYDEGWKLDDNWIPMDSIGTRDNYHHVPMLICSTPGSKLKFDFEGNAVGFAIAAGQDAGTIEYRIDKGPWQRQNLFTRWSASLHLPWYYTLASDLDDEMHELELRVVEGRDNRSKGSACRIRYFYINQSIENNN